MVATIFGTRPPDGITPITDERVRGRLGELYLKARLGWREIDLNQHNRRTEPPVDPDEVRRKILARFDRIAKFQRRGNSDEPDQT